MSGMRLRNGEHGYGVLTKTLHWLTVAAIAGQFTVGYAMDPDEMFDDAEDRLDELEERAEREGGAVEERFEAEEDRLDDAIDAAERDDEYAGLSDVFSGGLGDGLSLPEAHVLLGITVLVLGVLRVAWRIATPLPPWAERLTERRRRLAHLTEVTLLTLMFVIPLSGFSLLLGGDDWLPLHVGAHLLFFGVLAAHLVLVLRHRLLPRMLW